MAKVFIEESTLTAIGDAIRGKTGKTELIDPANMSTEIASIEAGGGGYVPTDEELTFKGDASYLFADSRNAWILNEYADRISTYALTSLDHMFKGCLTMQEIPFQLNVSSSQPPNLNYLLYMCYDLTVCPKIRGLKTFTSSFLTDSMFDSCQRLRDIEDLFLTEELANMQGLKITSSYSCPRPIVLKSMPSLRQVPSWWYAQRLNEESTAFPNSSYTPYYGMLSSCASVDELTNIPVWRCQGASTSNMFNGFCQNTSRIKSVTFETNADGTPITTKWKSQTIDFTSSKYVGYASSSSNTAGITNYNSGITKDKRVEDDATYQALKNDPDWYTWKPAYSRYNHDSAVETINSLPDTSEYLTSVGGTNTIKFNKAAGSATDGGAIQNLTTEEIAVAAAKGWTVTLS